MKTRQLVITLATLAAATGALAQSTVGHGIDANTFRPGHPASPRWVVTHANAEHPAVLNSRATRPVIDPNTFLVQPPAPVHWHAAAPAEAVQLAQASK